LGGALPTEWGHFVELAEALPTDQAAPLWQAEQVQAMKALGSSKFAPAAN
jgi:hypothetical protein